MTTNELVSLFKNDPGAIDIKDHLDTLTSFATGCDHVTEFGFREGASFSALLNANPKVAVTYDLHIPPEARKRFDDLKTQTKMIFHEENTLSAVIEETDLLFIDSLHTYSQLKKELYLHGSKVRKYLAFHDTLTFGSHGEDGSEPGLLVAIMEFMFESVHEWRLEYYSSECNGFIVIGRCDGQD